MGVWKYRGLDPKERQKLYSKDVLKSYRKDNPHSYYVTKGKKATPECAHYANMAKLVLGEYMPMYEKGNYFIGIEDFNKNLTASKLLKTWGRFEIERLYNMITEHWKNAGFSRYKRRAEAY